MNCDTSSLVAGTCTMDVYNTIGGSVQPKNRDLKELSADILRGFTMFIGFVVFVALIYSALLMIAGGADEKQLENGKKGVIYAMIGLFLVGFAYGIIRLVQLIAKG